MPQPNDLSSSLVALDQNSTIIAVVELSQSSCGRAPPAWVTWQVAVAREQSGQTWREYRARFGCEAIADSDRRGTGVCHHRSRSAATTIPTRPTTAIARIRSARQSAAKWNQPAIAQSTAGRRAGASQIDDAPQGSQSGDSAVPKPQDASRKRWGRS